MSKSQEYWNSLSRFDRAGLESFRGIVTGAFEAGYEARRAEEAGRIQASFQAGYEAAYRSGIENSPRPKSTLEDFCPTSDKSKLAKYGLASEVPDDGS